MFFVIGFAVNSTRDSGQNTSIFTKQLFIGSKAGENPKQLCWFQSGSSYQGDKERPKIIDPIHGDLVKCIFLLRCLSIYSNILINKFYLVIFDNNYSIR